MSDNRIVEMEGNMCRQPMTKQSPLIRVVAQSNPCHAVSHRVPAATWIYETARNGLSEPRCPSTYESRPSESDPRSDGARNHGPRHVFLNGKLSSPACTVTRHDHSGIKSLEIFHCGFDLIRITRGKVEATDHGVNWHCSTREMNCMLRSVDHAGVAARREHD